MLEEISLKLKYLFLFISNTEIILASGRLFFIWDFLMDIKNDSFKK
jgi:hypothetical protein